MIKEPLVSPAVARATTHIAILFSAYQHFLLMKCICKMSAVNNIFRLFNRQCPLVAKKHVKGIFPVMSRQLNAEMLRLGRGWSWLNIEKVNA